MTGFLTRCINAFLIFISLILLSACAATIYGVSEEQWSKMTDAQKQVAIERYNEHERLRKIEREKEPEREASEAEERTIEARRQEELRRERVGAIYRGEAGQYGDLIRVSIQGGKMKINGKHRSYQPVSFKMANGEVRKIEIVNNENKHYD